ncbi:hypothetical protein KUL152_23430 [Tenacibaculum sp. KUL152]|nr:hypothetical protein KUL152_23430 [Tenacibaculum sp. KUL152]
MNYEPHGNAKVYWQHDTLVVEVTGSINKEGAACFNQCIEKCIRGATSQQWARVERLDDHYVLCTPDSIPLLEKNMVLCKLFGCASCQVVGGNHLMHAIFQQICEKYEIPFAVSEG